MTSAAATILIVDDEPRTASCSRRCCGPKATRRSAPPAAKRRWPRSRSSAPDLILLDVMMPGMDGYQVAGILKADPATSNIPIIMVTAQIDRSARLAGLNAGAEEFLTKPVDRAELWLRVRNLLRLKAFGDFLQNHSAILEQQVQARTAELQRFRTAMDATADAIFLVSRTTMRFVEVNATACSMLRLHARRIAPAGPAQIHPVRSASSSRAFTMPSSLARQVRVDGNPAAPQMARSGSRCDGSPAFRRRTG